MEITLNVVREKIRKKMLYITTVLGILVVALFSSDMGSITIGGKNIKDYYVLVPILINIVNFLAGAIALALSVTTIPDEYERRTSHLIWSRGVKQSTYHMYLAAGNVLVSWISGFILYFTLGIFAILNGYTNILGTIALAVIFMMLYTSIICLLTTAISIKVPVVFTGAIMIAVLAFGAFRSVLTLLTSAFTGIGGSIIKRAILIIPDLAGISKQAGNLVQGKPVNAHVIVMGLLVIWIAGLGILLLRREEA
jgi:ABC-type transport system involved in multi-copper enzyme maturation permease subunit